MKYLRFIIKAGVGLQIDPEKIRAIREWETLKTKKRVRAFLGFANYYRVFINKFVITAAPFTGLTGKYPFLWTLKAQKAFKSLKKKLYFRPNSGPVQP